MTTLIVGQKLWYVPTDRRWSYEREVTIKKIGRVWATLNSGERVNLVNLRVDGKGYMSPGQCWPSREAWEAEKSRQEAWSTLYRAVRESISVPHNLNEQKIRAAIELLCGET